MAVPYTFGSATSSIPLSQLDSNFATGITLGNTTVYLGNTTTSFGNVTLTNVTISSVSTAITPAQGGTGLVTIPANNVILGNGTSNVTVVAPGTSGNVLTSNGTTWSSSTISAASVSAAGSTTQVQYNNAGAFAGSANLTFNGTTLTAAGLSGPHNGTVGATTPSTGSFTTLAASSTVSGTGFSTYLASPPAIGGTAPASGAFTTLTATTAIATTSGGTGLTSFTSGGVVYASSSSALATGSALTFNASALAIATAANDQLTWTSGRTGYLYADSAGIGIGDTALLAGNATYYNKTSNYIANYINGSEQMRLTSTGLGIGTSSPVAKLDVYQATAGTAALKILHVNGNGITVNPSYNYYDAFTHYFRSLSGTTTYATIDNSGNLGLGVTPSAWATFKAIELTGGAIAGIGTNQFDVVQNAYYDTSFKYKTTGAATFYQQSGATHAWYQAASGTAGNAITFTQAMTLDANGNWILGGTTAYAKATIVANASGGPLISFRDTNGSATNYDVAVFNRNGTQVGSISTTNSVTLYNTTSDQRLKENIVDAPEFGGVIDSIQVRSFDWKTSQTHQRAGFVAQELVTVVPEAVHQPADPDEMMTVDYSKLVPMLVKEIQSLRQRLAAANL